MTVGDERTNQCSGFGGFELASDNVFILARWHVTTGGLVVIGFFLEACANASQFGVRGLMSYCSSWRVGPAMWEVFKSKPEIQPMRGGQFGILEEFLYAMNLNYYICQNKKKNNTNKNINKNHNNNKIKIIIVISIIVIIIVQ